MAAEPVRRSPLTCSIRALHSAQETLVSGPAAVRNAGGDHAVGEGLAVGHAQPAIVDEGALAPLGGVELIEDGIVDEAADDLALPLERDRDCEHRNAMQKIGCAIKRIDDPAMRFVGAGDGAALLH